MMFLTNNASIQEVLLFPQMRPEKKALDLSEEEKVIYNLLKETPEIALAELKNQAGLSGKKWDNAMKALAKNDIVTVIVEGNSKTVVLAK